MGVLSLAKLAAGQEEYYLGLAEGVDDYYLASGEAPGRWMGRGADDLGLAGEVVGDDLRVVLAGEDPSGRQRIGSPNRRVPGFDCTISAPKSMSILYALGGPKIAAEVEAAHDQAVDAAVAYLERYAARSRTGPGGVHQVEGDGLIAAAFRHRTSRAGDPQLHTHVLVANSVKAADGTWRTLDARHLYGQQRTAGFVYQAALRAELTRRLGARWGPVVNGQADLAEIPDRLRRVFSQRRVEIVARLNELGHTSARAAQIATLATRPAKEDGVNYAELIDRWRARAAEAGIDTHDIDTVVRRGREPTPASITSVELGRRLTEHRSHFDRRDVIRAVADAATEGMDLEAIEARADRFLQSRYVTPLTPDLFGARYTTPEMLGMERHILDAVDRHRGDGVAVANRSDMDAAIDARPALSDEQAAMTRELTSSGAQVDVVVGPAGSGKTRALEAAHDAWRRSGHHVVGAALSARAAQELQAGSGIPSFTLDSLLGHLERNRLPRASVIVVDEAGMVGTRKLDRLLRAARHDHTKVVLVGDPQQLPEIEAGGVYATLARGPEAITLTANHRQHDPVERHALAAYRRDDIGGAVEQLDEHGRIHRHATADEAVAAVVEQWWHARRRGEETLMLALRRRDVDELNALARHQRQVAGDLGPDEIRIAGRAYATGDEIVTLRNARALGVLNGTRAVITALDPDRGALTVRVAGAAEDTTLPRWYLERGHIAHGYALTVHKAQGATVDVAIVYGDDRLYREAGYTALSRGRHANHLHTAVEPADQHDPLVLALQKSQAQQAAIELETKRASRTAGMSVA